MVRTINGSEISQEQIPACCEARQHNNYLGAICKEQGKCHVKVCYFRDIKKPQ